MSITVFTPLGTNIAYFIIHTYFGGLLDISVSIVSPMELGFYEHNVTEVTAADSSHLVSLESRRCVGLKGAFSFINSNLTFRTQLRH